MNQQERFSFETEFGRLYERVENIVEGQARLEQKITSHLEYHSADRESALKAKLAADQAVKAVTKARWGKVRTTVVLIACAFIGASPGILNGIHSFFS